MEAGRNPPFKECNRGIMHRRSSWPLQPLCIVGPDFNMFLHAAKVALLLGSSPAVLGYMHFSDEPGSCRVIGDADLYGVGIRWGFYLQFISILLALLARMDDGLRPQRIACNVVILSVWISLFVGRTTPNSLASYETVFVTMQTVAPLMALIAISIFDSLTKDQASTTAGSNDTRPAFESDVELPTRRVSGPHSHQPDEKPGRVFGFLGPLSWLNLLLVYIASCVGYVLYGGAQELVKNRKDDCPLWTPGWTNGTHRINLYEHNTMMGHSAAVTLLVLCLLSAIPIVGYIVLGMLYVAMGIGKDPRELRRKGVARASQLLRPVTNSLWYKWLVKKARRLPLPSRIGIAVAFFAPGIVSIVLLERLVKVSEIDLSSGPIDSSGQLVPLLVGIVGLLMTLWGCLCHSILWFTSGDARKWWEEFMRD
jgi:hypothetical protein